MNGRTGKAGTASSRHSLLSGIATDALVGRAGVEPTASSVSEKRSSTELPAQEMVPGQGFEPRPRRSERRVLPVRRSRTECLADVSFSHWPNDVFQAARLPFGPGSPIPVSGPASFVEGLWSPITGRLPEKSELKHTHYFLRHFRRQAPSDLSLSGGASIRTRSFSS